MVGDGVLSHVQQDKVAKWYQSMAKYIVAITNPKHIYDTFNDISDI